MNQNNKVAVIGAGRLGKGFLGASFIPSNYDVTFFDVNQQVIDELNKGYFNVDIHYTTHSCTKTYKDYNTCCLKDNNAVMLLSKHNLQIPPSIQNLISTKYFVQQQKHNLMRW